MSDDLPNYPRIWLQPFAGDEGSHTWCQDRQTDEDVEYVRAYLAPPSSPVAPEGVRLDEKGIEAALSARSKKFPFSVRTILSSHGVAYPSQADAIMRAAVTAYLSALTPAAEQGETDTWDIEEHKVWKGLDPHEPQWHGLGFACGSWADAAGLLDYLSRNDPSRILRVAPIVLAAAPSAKEA
jgi:hypothetical protein